MAHGPAHFAEHVLADALADTPVDQRGAFLDCLILGAVAARTAIHGPAATAAHLAILAEKIVNAK